jgi:hypothetical protein
MRDQSVLPDEVELPGADGFLLGFGAAEEEGRLEDLTLLEEAAEEEKRPARDGARALRGP